MDSKIYVYFTKWTISHLGRNTYIIICIDEKNQIIQRIITIIGYFSPFIMRFWKITDIKTYMCCFLFAHYDYKLIPVIDCKLDELQVIC